MLRDIVAFEWRYHARQPAFLAAALLFALLGFAMQVSGFGQNNVAINSPYIVMETAGFLSLLSVFVVAIFAANAVLRDVDHRMDGIVYSTAVGKFHYLFGRFGGAFLATSMVMLCGFVGVIVARFTPWVDATRIAPFHIAPYLASFAVITIPNVAFAAVLLFAIAVMTRNALATYAGAVVLYFLYLMTAALTNSPLMAASKPGAGGGAGAALLDPFGLSAFFEATRFWTAAAKNTNALGFQPLILINRGIWLVATAIIWLVVYRAFSFRTQRAAKPAKRASSGRFKTIAPIIAILLLWIGLAATETFSDLLNAEYGAALYPSTGLILETVRTPLDLLGTVLMLFIASELLWREQRYRIASIIDATPVSGARMIASKIGALAMLVGALVVAGILPGLLLQLARGPEHISVLAYLSFFASAGFPLLLLGVAVLFINALSPGKYAGMMLSLLFVIITRRPAFIGLDHPLLRFASVPPLRYSEVNGFGYDVLPFAAFLLFWTSIAALFFLLAATLWRGLVFSVRERVRLLPRAPRFATVFAVILSVAIGAWLYARIDNEDVIAWRADYEKTYGPLAALPQPRVAGIDVNVDLYDRRVVVNGRYELVNATATPISRVLVAMRREARDVTIAMRGATMKHDERFGIYDVALAKPLAPGARTELQFTATLVRDRFSSDDDDAIAKNGTFLMSFRFLPSIGYRRTYEIEDPRERRKRGLAKRVEFIEGDVPADAEDIRFAATVSTPASQTAIAPGKIERTWTRGDRRYTRFVQPVMRNFFAIGSAHYAKQIRMYGDKPIELYYEPSHAVNAKQMLEVAAKTLEYCEKNFGPYRPAQLRMAEVPSYWNFGALAMPNTIFLTEHRTFLIDTRDPNRADLLGRRIAHEVGHQWWGYEVAPGSEPGATFIVESFAKYTELMVLERLHGREHVRMLLDVDRDRYLAGRAGDENAEMPLLRVGNQAHIYYGKGAIVLYAIRDLLGEAQFNGVLKTFVAEQSSRHGLTRADDLLPHLRRVSTDEQYALITQWLGEIVLYDLSIASANVHNGVITTQIKARKLRADGDGNETPLPFRESIDIRVTDAAGKALYERKHVLDGDDTITIPVSGQPLFLEVDPWLHRIDRNLEDNNVRLEAN